MQDRPRWHWTLWNVTIFVSVWSEVSWQVSVCWLQRGSKKAKRDDDEFDVADVSDIQPRARSGRSAKPVNYHFDSDDDDDDM